MTLNPTVAVYQTIATVEVIEEDGEAVVVVAAEGPPGSNAAIVGVTVETLAPGAEATAENVGTEMEAILHFGIPRGEQGETGGAYSNATPQPLGTAAAGIADTGSRSDHVHAMPSAADVGADADGTAAAAISAHESAADPHPGYLTAAEANAAYAPIGVTGATNLSYTAATRVLASDTGTDATLPLADGTNPGLMASADFTKLSGIAAGAEANVNADWNAGSGDAQILNKPTLGTAAAAATTDFAPAAQGVTNGNSHDHSGGDGAQIAYSSLSGLPTLGTLAAQNGTFSGTSSGTNTGDQDLSGKANTGAIGSSGITMSTARLLGRSTASAGAVEEITLGTNLSFTGTTLNAAGGDVPPSAQILTHSLMR
jgi:hypothetical protein